MQEHPDTVGGAMLTGIREAVRALHLLRRDSPEAAGEAADMVASETHRPRKQVLRPPPQPAGALRWPSPC